MKRKLFTIALLAASAACPAVLAQQAPGAGGQIQQIPPPPLLQKSIPEIRIEKRGEPPSPVSLGAKVLVQSLHITGASKFSEAELIAAAQFLPGSELDLAGLRLLASKISDYYNVRGYFVAQAYLPAQEINQGAVTIAVIEGQYGKITLNNQSRLSDHVASTILSGLDSGDIVASAPLERRLLLLSDLPGVEVRSTLIPGTSVGTSDLIVDLTPGRWISGSLEADNAGNYYTGEDRVGGSVNFNEIIGEGDVASLRALTSTTGGLTYGRASYQMQAGDATLGVAYAMLWYRLGKAFAPLNARGTANIASIYGSYPLLRSYDNNLYAVADFDAKSFRDKIGVPSSVTDKQAHVGILGLHGNHHDDFGGGGWDNFSLSASFGSLDIQTPAARAADGLTARSNGGYSKFSFEADRTQTISGPFSLYAEIRGQVASKNLDVSEKMELGGAYAVRSYPEGEGYGDEGYVMTFEARYQLPRFEEGLPGRMTLIGFVDTGSVTLNHSPWAPGPNSRSLGAIGAGFTWADDNDFLFSAFYARKLGNSAATAAPDSQDRIWLQIVKLF